MAMFSAYFDESGTKHGGAAFTVGGGVSTVEKWANLEEKWERIISEYGLTLFHAREWCGNPNHSVQERESLLIQLAKCIRRHVRKTVSVSIPLRHWRRANKTFRLEEEIGNPYPFCGAACIAYIGEWAQNHGVSLTDIEFFFETGAEHRGELVKLCRKEYGVEIILAGKQRLPFQVGDLLAWSGRRNFNDLIGGKQIDMAFLNEIQKSAHDSKYLALGQLFELCQGVPVAPRSPQLFDQG